MIDDGTQAGGGCGAAAMRLSLVSGTGKVAAGAGGAYGEMVETASIYANAADGVDNLGYVNDVIVAAADDHRQRHSAALLSQQLVGQRTVRPVIHFPKPPPVAGAVDGAPVSPTSSQHSQSGR